MANSHILFNQIVDIHGSECLICCTAYDDTICLLKCCNKPICPSCYVKREEVGVIECFFCRKPNKRIIKKLKEQDEKEAKEIKKKIKYYRKKYVDAYGFMESLHYFMGKFQKYQYWKVIGALKEESLKMHPSTGAKLIQKVCQWYDDNSDSDSDDE